MASPAAALLSVLLIVCVSVASCEYNASALSALIDSMLAEYDREAAPAGGRGGAVAVRATLDVRHATILERQSAMRLLADLKLSWIDPRIGWNVTEWGTESVLTAAERLWLPDVVLLNAAATSDVGEDALRARLSAAGAVSWISRVDVTAPVAMDLYYWPRDVHSCTFKFGSRTFNNDELVLTINDLEHAIVFESGTWNVVSISGGSSQWERGDGTAALAAWSVTVARHAPAHAAAAAAVLLAAAGMLLAAVMLPPAQRHPLAACASFTAALWLITALARLPAAASCPRAFSVMCGACVAGALVAAGAALVRRVARARHTPPRCLRALLSRLSTVCRLTPTEEEREQESSCSGGGGGGGGAGAWAAAALLADRALAAATLLTLLVLLAVQLS